MLLSPRATRMEIVNRSEFLSYQGKVHARTARVIARVPAEHLEWTYRPGKFTCGDLIRHLATSERYMFAENVAGRPSRYPGHGRELADGHDQVLALYERLHQETLAILTALQAEDFARQCETPGGATLPVWKWLRSMLEHEIHHRGQLYLYLGILGVPTPPLYGLTSEEVRERSVL
jgi:uncharacterized damage-inducible protein DinB